MLMVIPTWVVTLDPGNEELEERYRVPQSDLESFLKVLIFNSVEAFDVRLESDGHGG
jgi:hypothetical protein